jgi:hypothetical protein
MKLYPQFHPVDTDRSIGSDWVRLTNLIKLRPAELEAHRKNYFSEEMFEFSKIGTHITEKELDDIYFEMLGVAQSLGYPNKRDKRIDSDGPWAEILHKRMGISRNEASKTGIWNALSCHYMPNLVAWRWEDPNKNTEGPSDRWITQSKRERHAFARLWWRAELLMDDVQTHNPYQLLYDLGEDEMVQLMERPELAAHPKICRAFAKYHLKKTKNKPTRDSLRKGIKNLRLRASILDLDLIESAGKSEAFTIECYDEVNLS